MEYVIIEPTMSKPIICRNMNELFNILDSLCLIPGCLVYNTKLNDDNYYGISRCYDGGVRLDVFTDYSGAVNELITRHGLTECDMGDRVDGRNDSDDIMCVIYWDL